ncbi:MAG: hypothetical protein IJP74_04720 [Prevotella sp.]|nr:hypothetical protein [Prevotella sp.]
MKTRIYVLLSVLLAMAALPAQASDWVLNEDKYWAYQSGDHLCLEVFLADLDGKNTYSTGGYVYATNGSKTIDLVYLEYINDGDDEDKTAKVKAYRYDSNTRAWFTNNSGASEITGTNTTFWLYKWGGDNHYMTAYIDFYFPASMAGETWQIGYRFKHSNGDWYTKKLRSSITVDGSLGLSPMTTSNYTCERTSPDNIKFTVPKLPDDIPSKVADMRERACSYNVSYIFTKQDGTTTTLSETYACDKNQAKTYTATIPAEAGNPKQIDLRVTATQGVKDSKDYYWTSNSSYIRNSVFKVVPVPESITSEYRQFDKSADLSWTSPTGSNYLDCTPYIYRIETDANGNIPSGKTWSKRGTIDNASGTTLNFNDNNVTQGSYFRYMVVNVPKDWVNKGVSSTQLSSPDDDLLSRLGHATTETMSTDPSMTIYALQQDTAFADRVKLMWQYSRVPTDAASVNFKVMRKTSDDAEWAEYATVNGKSQPDAGTTLSFVDESLPNVTVRYQYKVRLSLLSGKYEFESDPIYAGKLKGSQVKDFSATKGTHDTTVRLSWTATNSTAENATYVISRRYVNTYDDFMRINTTSGTAEQFTFEDNTVQPGYYYEYKVEAYSGNVLQNTLYDVGFCQARGVISGRITFGGGDAVEDVRMNLQPSDTGDDNTVRGHSQRVGGASTGIAWQADSAETAKVFGAGKDFTVQMFVRPDSLLGEGAVIGEIPQIGQLVLHGKSGEGYKLWVNSSLSAKPVHRNIRGIWVNGVQFKGDNTEDYYYDPAYNRNFYYVDTHHNTTDLWLADGYTHAITSMTYLSGQRCYRILYFKDSYDTEEQFFESLHDTGLTLPAGVYSQITMALSGEDVTLAVNDNSTTTTMAQLGSSEAVQVETTYTCEGDLANISDILESCAASVESKFPEEAMVSIRNKLQFSVGGAQGVTEEQAFQGNLAEVRVWNHALTDDEKSSYADRMLNGREQGLALYWPMDEGLDRYVFDASFANDLPNGRHATVGINIMASTIVPATNQLSRYGVTNQNGEYIIRGIPFVGSGSTYTVLPTKGIHEFNPTSRNGFIGNGNLTLNSYDFTDVSSFPVKGKITYLNTNIPVEGVQFMIDGKMVQSKEGVKSDANGEYEISVPIGEHLLECYMNGHRFTSFPLDGSTHDFKKAETVNFVDSTLVNVTGRINGGFSDQNAPVGFNQSVNRIGKATVKLSLGKESQCSFNYIVDDHGDGTFGKVNIPVASATDSIRSTAYRAGGDHDDTYYIYITTDERNGEFSAMLPPLKYKVESIRIEGDKGDTIYNDKQVFAQNLPLIDATNAVKEKMQADSVANSVGKYDKYTYSAKMLRQYRADPVITVAQKDTKNGAFGDEKVAVHNLQNEVDTLQVLTYTADGYKYEYGYPIFVQNKTYDFDINIAENYTNLDTKETFKEVPRDALVSISNDASVLSSVTTQKEMIDGKEQEAGMTVESFKIQVTPDSTGHVAYSFMGGWPNLAEGHLRNMNVSVTVDGRTTMWEASKDRTALDLILLGCLPSGTNFMTEGPDKVDYILRRPPGSTSVASFERTEITAHNKSTVNVTDESDGPGLYISLSPTFKIGTGVGILGPILMTDSKWEFVAKETVTKMFGTRDEEYYTDNVSYSLTEKTATPNNMPYSIKYNAYRPENGDTYVGHATNLTFSKARTLGFYQDSSGKYELTEKDGIAMSESFKTNFIYTQEYIEDYLIPNWKAFINDRLIHVDGNHWDKNNPQVKKVPGEIRYYTSYSPGDKEYGLSNGDPTFDAVRKERNNWPSYRMVNGMNDAADADEVGNAINQILAWESTMASNEADKLKAFEDNSMLIGNYSISGGTTYSQTVKNDTVKTVDKGLRHSTYITLNSETKIGALINDAGINAIINVHNYDSELTDTVTLRTRSKTVAWTMSDGDTRTALSVDVFKSPQGWGPIFRTRAGQTVNPYEGETRTAYYKKGDESEKLNEGTMRVELPQLKVDGSTELTDVPTGTEAKFTLQLFNNSESKDVCTYVLEAADKSNPAGAILMMDGTPLSNGKLGRTFKMAGGETLVKTLLVSQGDRSVTNYDGIELVLKSEKDISVVSDPVKLQVHFVPASTSIDLAVNHTVLNKTDKDTIGGIIATVYNIDRQDKDLLGIRLRYRRKGMDTWNLVKQWTVKDSLLAFGYEPMPAGSRFNEPVTFAEDGLYELQAQSFGLYGNEEVTYQSSIIEITQDTHGSKILGMVSPENGQLTYMNRNNMHLRFNEVLNENALSKSDNFRIEGGMNNVVFGKSPYPDVAALLNGNAIETDALYDLSGSDYAFDLWFYRQGDGTIISLGTEDNLLALSTHDGGKLQARVGGDEDVFDTGATLPANKWMYMALDYKHRTSDDPQNRITMLYVTADDTNPNYVGKNQPAKVLDGHGKLSVGGDGMTGMIAGLSIWNSDVTADELYETRNQQRASYTPGLVGYWRMDEGHGTQLIDRVRSRNMHMDSESWYINNENRAAHLDGSDGSSLKVDISTFNPAKTDNFAYEMWFRGEDAYNGGLTMLMSVDNVSTADYNLKTAICFEYGELVLKQIEDVKKKDENNKTVEERNFKNDILLSEHNYLDGNWHHLALNVRRGVSAVVYVDGQAVKVVPETSIPGISSHYLMVGSELSDGKEWSNFTGDVDEIRIWNAALDGHLISNRMYERMDNSYPGLVGYFPMEDIHRTAQGNVVTEFSLKNFGEKDSLLTISSVAGDSRFPTQALTAPALKPGSTKMRLDDSQFNFTASADEIYFSFPDSSLPLMDGNDFTATVSHIKDEHGNNSETVQWLFHADFASVDWSNGNQQLYPTIHYKKWNEELTFVIPVYNRTGQPQNYEISGLPTWMSVDKPIGTIENDKVYLEFYIGKMVPVGKYVVYIYLTDHLGIRRVQQANITVEGDAPEWNVNNPDKFESNMTMTGQVYIGDKICEYTETMVAAFDDMNQCVGVGKPRYVATRDAYFVDMIVYGAAPTDLSTGESRLTFKMYDASTGTIYPIVELTMPDGIVSRELTYMPDALIGSYDAPVEFRSTDEMLQTVSLPRGWTWMSMYVQPESTDITDVLPKKASDLLKFQNVKSKTGFSSATTENKQTVIKGSLTEMVPGQMYKIQTSADMSLDIYGKSIDVTQQAQTIRKGYNWIGTLSGSVMSPDEAFADLQPEVGDMVKGRRSYAIFGNRGTWEGLLESIVPGEGYVYQSKADATKTFHYPRSFTSFTTSTLSSARRAKGGVSHYQPVDDSQFPDNMTIITVVELDGAPVENAEVAAFIGNECRGAVSYHQGYYFLTIMGSSADDLDATIELRVWLDGKEYTVENKKRFVSDASYGTLDEPYVLDLTNVPTGISVLDDTSADTDWFTVQGIRIGHRPTVPGVYIHNGEKVTVKRKK